MFALGLCCVAAAVEVLMQIEKEIKNDVLRLKGWKLLAKKLRLNERKRGKKNINLCLKLT